jgi:RNA polymerase sigma factor (sigma-70 family)
MMLGHLRLDHDTDMGGRQERFPLTRHSIIAMAGSEDQAERVVAFNAIIECYWKPIYKYIRIKWQKSNEDAKDLTQAFFCTCIEKGFLRSFDPQVATFRTFIRILIDRFVSNENKASQRIKRGGGYAHASFDFETAEAELALAGQPSEFSMDDYFRQEWIRTVFSLAVAELQELLNSNGKGTHFSLFELYDLDDNDERSLSYKDLAREFEISETAVTNYLALARREFRRIVLAKLKELTASEEEFRAEAKSLLRVTIK